ncbi:MAG TPA: protein-methionine-sulfoxide reductase catalytic subunit MsrP [Tepidisphaeraceae bacterium]|jgi:sulfoxide reductase catalytic subunit YedY
MKKVDRVTPESTYLNRRTFMRGGILAATTLVTATVYRKLNGIPATQSPTRKLANLSTAPSPTTSPSTQRYLSAFRTDETPTPLADITHYNNFYEFSTDKQEVAEVAAKFVSRPWTVTVAGLCSTPKTFDLDDLFKLAVPEERIYRMRCVEGWSMVIPWAGFSLSKLLDAVQPLASAKYVAFETLFDPKRMANQNSRVLDWPYVEGLRMDEAMHPLTLLATGLYGHELPPQDGAPVRLVIPWKYGFKGIKSIVKVTLTETQPPTTWSAFAPSEYGFYANVNPEVDHPRWSQASEQRIGEYRKRKTLMFNGYANEVAHLYHGMDLRRYY